MKSNSHEGSPTQRHGSHLPLTIYPEDALIHLPLHTRVTPHLMGPGLILVSAWTAVAGLPVLGPAMPIIGMVAGVGVTGMIEVLMRDINHPDQQTFFIDKGRLQVVNVDKGRDLASFDLESIRIVGHKTMRRGNVITKEFVAAGGAIDSLSIADRKSELTLLKSAAKSELSRLYDIMTEEVVNWRTLEIE